MNKKTKFTLKNLGVISLLSIVPITIVSCGSNDSTDFTNETLQQAITISPTSTFTPVNVEKTFVSSLSDLKNKLLENKINFSINNPKNINNFTPTDFSIVANGQLATIKINGHSQNDTNKALLYEGQVTFEKPQDVQLSTQNLNSNQVSQALSLKAFDAITPSNVSKTAVNSIQDLITKLQNSLIVAQYKKYDDKYFYKFIPFNYEIKTNGQTANLIVEGISGTQKLTISKNLIFPLPAANLVDQTNEDLKTSFSLARFQESEQPAPTASPINVNSLFQLEGSLQFQGIKMQYKTPKGKSRFIPNSYSLKISSSNPETVEVTILGTSGNSKNLSVTIPVTFSKLSLNQKEAEAMFSLKRISNTLKPLPFSKIPVSNILDLEKKLKENNVILNFNENLNRLSFTPTFLEIQTKEGSDVVTYIIYGSSGNKEISISKNVYFSPLSLTKELIISNNLIKLSPIEKAVPETIISTPISSYNAVNTFAKYNLNYSFTTLEGYSKPAFKNFNMVVNSTDKQKAVLNLTINLGSKTIIIPFALNYIDPGSTTDLKNSEAIASTKLSRGYSDVRKGLFLQPVNNLVTSKKVNSIIEMQNFLKNQGYDFTYTTPEGKNPFVPSEYKIEVSTIDKTTSITFIGKSGNTNIEFTKKIIYKKVSQTSQEASFNTFRIYQLRKNNGFLYPQPDNFSGILNNKNFEQLKSILALKGINFISYPNKDSRVFDFIPESYELKTLDPQKQNNMTLFITGKTGDKTITIQKSITFYTDLNQSQLNQVIQINQITGKKIPTTTGGKINVNSFVQLQDQLKERSIEIKYLTGGGTSPGALGSLYPYKSKFIPKNYEIISSGENSTIIIEGFSNETPLKFITTLFFNSKTDFTQSEFKVDQEKNIDDSTKIFKFSQIPGSALPTNLLPNIGAINYVSLEGSTLEDFKKQLIPYGVNFEYNLPLNKTDLKITHFEVQYPATNVLVIVMVAYSGNNGPLYLGWGHSFNKGNQTREVAAKAFSSVAVNQGNPKNAPLTNVDSLDQLTSILYDDYNINLSYIQPIEYLEFKPTKFSISISTENPQVAILTITGISGTNNLSFSKLVTFTPFPAVIEPLKQIDLKSAFQFKAEARALPNSKELTKVNSLKQIISDLNSIGISTSYNPVKNAEIFIATSYKWEIQDRTLKLTINGKTNAGKEISTGIIEIVYPLITIDSETAAKTFNISQKPDSIAPSSEALKQLSSASFKTLESTLLLKGIVLKQTALSKDYADFIPQSYAIESNELNVKVIINGKSNDVDVSTSKIIKFQKINFSKAIASDAFSFTITDNFNPENLPEMTINSLDELKLELGKYFINTTFIQPFGYKEIMVDKLQINVKNSSSATNELEVIIKVKDESSNIFTLKYLLPFEKISPSNTNLTSDELNKALSIANSSNNTTLPKEVKDVSINSIIELTQILKLENLELTYKTPVGKKPFIPSKYSIVNNNRKSTITIFGKNGIKISKEISFATIDLTSQTLADEFHFEQVPNTAFPNSIIKPFGSLFPKTIDNLKSKLAILNISTIYLHSPQYSSFIPTYFQVTFNIETLTFNILIKGNSGSNTNIEFTKTLIFKVIELNNNNAKTSFTIDKATEYNFKEVATTNVSSIDQLLVELSKLNYVTTFNQLIGTNLFIPKSFSVAKDVNDAISVNIKGISGAANLDFNLVLPK